MRSNIASRWLSVPLLVALMSGASPSDAVAQDTDENPYTSRIDTRMGRRLFQEQCSTCHGLNAAGGNEATGPDLTTGQLRHASSDAGLFRVIRDGVPGTSMIGVGADAQEQTVWQLVTYLRSREAANAVVDLAGSPAAGQRLFNGKGDCIRCHMVNGVGSRLGPDLSYVGNRRDPGELQSDLTEPDAEVNPRWWTMRAVGTDGRRFEGLRMDEDTFTFRIMDAEENLRSFSKYGDWSYERIKTSTMPSAADSLTATERDDLVAYLFSLRRDR
jgi:putative heme-binding domain-containing protein